MPIILLALIWFKTDVVPVFVAFLMAFPILRGNMIDGIRNVDTLLLRMAEVYAVPRSRVNREIYPPSAPPYLTAAMSSSAGITWKVIVTAEVSSQPIRAVGTGRQLAKYGLDTASVFAWTAVAIALTAPTAQALERAQGRTRWRQAHDER